MFWGLFFIFLMEKKRWLWQKLRLEHKKSAPDRGEEQEARRFVPQDWSVVVVESPRSASVLEKEVCSRTARVCVCFGCMWVCVGTEWWVRAAQLEQQPNSQAGQALRLSPSLYSHGLRLWQQHGPRNDPGWLSGTPLSSSVAYFGPKNSIKPPKHMMLPLILHYRWPGYH